MELVPKHVAIIMDGNGRWALERGLARICGHRVGVERVREILQAAMECKVEYLTLFAFSTENWQRPKEEVRALFGLLRKYLRNELLRLIDEGVQLRVIGRPLPDNLQTLIEKAVSLTAHNNKIILILALNYSGRAELVDAVNAILASDHKVVDERIFENYLYTKDIPHPDLLIRTSGELRISNFMLWQLAYTELWVTKKYWPDFTKDDFLLAIEDYSKRERRFGKISQQIHHAHV